MRSMYSCETTFQFYKPHCRQISCIKSIVLLITLDIRVGNNFCSGFISLARFDLAKSSRMSRAYQLETCTKYYHNAVVTMPNREPSPIEYYPSKALTEGMRNILHTE